MINYVLQLLTPSDTEGVYRVLQHTGWRYVRHIYLTFGRTDALWDDRDKGSLIDSVDYLLAYYRYIELNPVRAKMVGEL
ncbi:MAG: transposase [Moraxellaceae bacterium]|jgi:putative transposase|nr:transposase [Moraxellaceae bacterium]